MSKVPYYTKTDFCIVPDCEDTPAHAIVQEFTCGCNVTKLSCLMGHVALIQIWSHKGAHGEAIAFEADSDVRFD